MLNVSLNKLGINKCSMNSILVSEIWYSLSWRCRQCIGVRYLPTWHVNLNPLTPKDPYSGRFAPLTSKRCILYIYSTNTGTEYFKHGIYCPLFSLQNAVCFIILTYLVPVLFTNLNTQCAKIKKKNNSGAKRLMYWISVNCQWMRVSRVSQSYVLSK